MGIFIHMVNVDSGFLNVTSLRMANEDMVRHGTSNFSTRAVLDDLLVGCARIPALACVTREII